MVISWSPSGDFSEVVDTLESVTILRCDRQGHAVQAEAWRFEEVRADSAQAPGSLWQTITTWQFSLPEVDVSPVPSDRLVDAQGRCATIRSARRQQGATRYVCETVRNVVTAKSRQVFDIQRPIVVNGQGGSTIEQWELAQTGVEGCFPRRQEDPLEESPAIDIALVGPDEVVVGARLLSRRGGEYAVTAVDMPKIVGDPWVVTTVELDTSA
ncbi:hypothetical protein MalM25_34220 [Planctomycetes bacterium MalM25]|nr:hypothetical protein MalM25_34220 [Planctomycetes bacterium MalM25]